MNQKKARLDADGNAKPLTEIVIKAPNNGNCIGPGMIPPGCTLEYRESLENVRQSLENVRRAIRDDYIKKLISDKEFNLRQSSRYRGIEKEESLAMADECEKIIHAIYNLT